MKSNVIKNFKQTYKAKDGSLGINEYRVTIVKDTTDYTYRILNLNSWTIWSNRRFKTFNEAVNFLDKHPHNTERITN